jgi:hypothetical protein
MNVIERTFPQKFISHRKIFIFIDFNRCKFIINSINNKQYDYHIYIRLQKSTFTRYVEETVTWYKEIMRTCYLFHFICYQLH